LCFDDQYTEITFTSKNLKEIYKDKAIVGKYNFKLMVKNLDKSCSAEILKEILDKIIHNM